MWSGNYSCQKEYLVLIYKCLGKWELHHELGIISCALKKIDNNENAIHEKSSAMDELY